MDDGRLIAGVGYMCYFVTGLLMTETRHVRRFIMAASEIERYPDRPLFSIDSSSYTSDFTSANSSNA